MIDEIAAARIDQLGERVAGAGESVADFLGLGAERCGDAAAGAIDALGDAAARLFELFRQRIMGAGHRGADTLGIADDRFTFGRQAVDERADAPLILGIGALQSGHFGAHDRLEFAGARQRPFDAVAHRGDLAADRLRQGDDLSVATVSGSASRIATSVIARAVRRISWARRAKAAATKKKITGPSVASATRAAGAGTRPAGASAWAACKYRRPPERPRRGMRSRQGWSVAGSSGSASPAGSGRPCGDRRWQAAKMA